MLRAEGGNPIFIYFSSILLNPAPASAHRAAAGTAMVAGPPVAGDSEGASLLSDQLRPRRQGGRCPPSICPATTLAPEVSARTKADQGNSPTFQPEGVPRESERSGPLLGVRAGQKYGAKILTAWQRLNKSDTELHARAVGSLQPAPRGLITCLKKPHILHRI